MGAAVPASAQEAADDFAELYLDRYFPPGKELQLGVEGERRSEALAHYARGLSLEIQERPDEAIAAFRRVLEIDPGGEEAACRSVYTVYQEAPGLSLQVILCGRYHDAFVRRDGAWRFAARDYRLVDLVGDVSRHLRPAMAGRLQARASQPVD